MNTRSLVRLGDVCRPRQWPTLSKKELVADGFPVYGANGKIGFASEFTHTKPTLLIGCRGSCGSVHITEPFSYANGNAMALDDLNEDLIDIKYIYHYFVHRGFRDVITGTSQPQIIQQHLRKVAIPLPPLEEQRRIAAILNKIIQIDLLQKKAIKTSKNLSRSYFLAMFGDPHQNLESWKELPLKDLGYVVTGKTPPSSQEGMFDGCIPFITPGDLGSCEPAKRTLTEAGSRSSKTVEKGSALVCCIGATIGKMDIAAERAAFNQQINAVEWGDQVLSEYGIEALRFYNRTIAKLGASTTLPILKKSSFEKLKIPVPPLELQREFASKLREIQNQTKSIDRAIELSKALLGSIRSEIFSKIS